MGVIAHSNKAGCVSPFDEIPISKWAGTNNITETDKTPN
jgi:hypothetical protein